MALSKQAEVFESEVKKWENLKKEITDLEQYVAEAVKEDDLSIAKEAYEKGAVFLKIILDTEPKETYVTSLTKFSTYATTLDNDQMFQYSMPIHDFIKI